MNIIFMGPPGAGKGTVAQALISAKGAYDIAHVSTGDLLRKIVKEDTELSRAVQQYMGQGAFVPDAIVLDLLTGHIQKSGSEVQIIDGFPRTLGQAKSLDTLVSIDHVFYLALPDEEIIRRLSGRRVHSASGKIYNINPDGFPKPPGGMEHSELQQREDDMPDVIKERLELARKETQPILDFYKDKNLLHVIDTDVDVMTVVDEIRRVASL